VLGLAGVGRWQNQDHGAYQTSTLNYSDANPAAFDAEERLRVMDQEGFDGAVLYPSLSLMFHRDRDLAEELNRAVNNWLADWVSVDRSRLYGAVNIGIIRDVSWACDEIRRCVDHFGFKAVCIRDTLGDADTRWWDRSFDLLWATCQDLDVAVAMHPAAGDSSYGACRYFGLASREPVQLFLRTPFGNPVDAMNMLGGLIGGGALERFPRLRVGILESGGSWLVPFLERLDSRFEHVGSQLPTRLSLKPSEYATRQCWISFDPEEAGLTFSCEWLGADRIIWAPTSPIPMRSIRECWTC
jgi:predicted TIM-barrel fold metal-dependent hydrolase